MNAEIHHPHTKKECMAENRKERYALKTSTSLESTKEANDAKIGNTAKCSQTNATFHGIRCPINMEAHEKIFETITFDKNIDSEDKSSADKENQEQKRQQLL